MRTHALLLSLLCLSCASCSSNILNECHTRNDPQMMREIEEELYASIEKQGLHRVYKGPQAYMSLDEKFWLTLRTQQFYFESTDEARSFFVKKIQYLLSLYNNSYKLRPFLENYPVKASDLWLTINLYQNPKELARPPELCRLELKNNTISYYRWDEDKKVPVVIFSETYRPNSKNHPATS